MPDDHESAVSNSRAELGARFLVQRRLPQSILNSIHNREARVAELDVCQCLIQFPPTTPVKIRNHHCGRARDTSMAMDIHSVFLVKQPFQRFHTSRETIL